jgi:biotin transport system substrate-specific component
VSIAQTQNITLIDKLVARTRINNVILVISGVLLTALSAQLSIPALPLPFTLQTLAVLVIGSTYGAARGSITMAVYALVGALGLPVFEGASSGFNVLFGSTGGFIIGFIFAAAVAGRLAELNWSSNALKALCSFVASTVVIYGFGIPVLAMIPYYEANVFRAAQDMLPFLIWDAAKAVFAAALIPSAWLLVKKLDKKN